MFHRYDYEAEYYPTMSRLPLDLRRKLDVTGIKISLKDWLTFSREERVVLCHLPCDVAEEKQAFGAYLDFLAKRYLGRTAKKLEPLAESLWSEAQVPAEVGERGAASQQTIDLAEWRRWPAHHRYALYKTAVSTSQPEAFEQVLHQLRRWK
jgi:hypothetical protein